MSNVAAQAAGHVKYYKVDYCTVQVCRPNHWRKSFIKVMAEVAAHQYL